MASSYYKLDITSREETRTKGAKKFAEKDTSQACCTMLVKTLSK